MTIESVDWSVVVVGAWNLAILTPDGIRKRLLELPEGSALDIELAVDRPGAFRVRHGGLIIEPTPLSLNIISEQSTPESIQNACNIATKALSGLPETPLSAIGVNFKYRITELPDESLALVDCPLDDALSDVGATILGRSIKRTLEHDEGNLNIELSWENEGNGLLGFNYHLNAVAPTQLSTWLTKILAFNDRTNALMNALFLGQ